jgi:hypothetical protein
VVGLPIGNGLHHPHQALHEVLQVLPPRKSCSKSDFRKVCKYLLLGLMSLHLFIKFYQNYFCGLGVKAFFEFFIQKIVKCQLFCKKPCQIKSFSLIAMKFISIILRQATQTVTI